MEIVNNATTPPTTLNLSVLQVWLKGPKGWQLVARHSNEVPLAMGGKARRIRQP